MNLADAIRGVNNLDLQYYLSEEVDLLLLIFLMLAVMLLSQHQLGDQPEYKSDPNIPWWQSKLLQNLKLRKV